MLSFVCKCGCMVVGCVLSDYARTAFGNSVYDTVMICLALSRLLSVEVGGM